MQKFDTFYFEGFEFDFSNLKAKFFYSFDQKQNFIEEIDFFSNFKFREKLEKNIINNILFSIHLALGISYYKLFPTEKLIVKSGILTENQIKFWEKFYKNGLGEFLYINNINPKGLFNFENDSKTNFKKTNFALSKKSLVPVGGGKDSIVTVELFKKMGIDFDLFVFGKTDILKENTAKIAGKNTLLTKRRLSENLFKLNKSGYYNGHVPITGIIAFNMLLVAYLYDYKYLVLSNELSANIGNTLWKGFEINHQYSKSLEFEKDFKSYVEEYISDDIKYFSFLRGMYEYKIAKLFSKYAKKYFTSFSSCNFNFKIFSKDKLEQTDKKYWCNNCPKCAFVYSILSGFLNREELMNIFGEDLYEKQSLEKLFRELLGISGIKPFECVGEKDEVVMGMYNSIKNYENDRLPFILEIFKNEVLVKYDKCKLEKIEKKLLKVYDDDIIPKEFKKILRFN